MLTREAGENPLPLRRVERRQPLLDRLVGRLVRSRPRPGVEFLRAGPVAREVERELEELLCRLLAQPYQIADRVDATAALDLAAGTARASVVAPELHVGPTLRPRPDDAAGAARGASEDEPGRDFTNRT